MGPTTNPLDTTERREDLRTDEEKDEVLAWVRPRSISFPPYFTPYANIRVPRARRYVASHPYRGPPPPRSEHDLHTLLDSRHSDVSSSATMSMT